MVSVDIATVNNNVHRIFHKVAQVFSLIIVTKY